MSNAYACRGFVLHSTSWTSPGWRREVLPLAPTPLGISTASDGATRWLYWEGPRGATLYSSATGRSPYSHWSVSGLASTVACGLIPESLTHLFAECPTGMDVSFLASTDAGRTWIPVNQRPFSGTGGGVFDPVSATLAFVEYGNYEVTRGADLFRFSNDGPAVPSGRLNCDDAQTLDFVDQHHGLALCSSVSAHHPGPVLETTSDGGRTWSAVNVGAP